MPHPLLRPFRYPTETALLLALIFFIPLFEVPKNLLLVAYAVVWVRNRHADGWSASNGGRWDGWDTLFAVWLSSVYIVAIFAGLHKNEWRGTGDLWRYIALAWLLKRSGYADLEWRAIYAAIAVSTLVATLWGIVALAVPHTYAGIELHSVGHVNHSAVYITISIGAVLSGLVAYWPRLPVRWRIAGLATLAVFGIAIMLAGSRAATIVSLLLLILMGALWSRRSKAVLLALSVALLVFTVSIQTFDKDMHRKNELARASANPMLNERYPLWNQAIAAWRAHPWFGVGINNFDEINVATVKRWVEERGDLYDPAEYARSSHAHSLFLTNLAERGAFGLSVVLAVLAAWAYSLLRRWPQPTDPRLHWMLWGGAGSALLTTVAIGVVNTTLHHEHGLLSMLLLGAWLGSVRARALAASQPVEMTVVRLAVDHSAST